MDFFGNLNFALLTVLFLTIIFLDNLLLYLFDRVLMGNLNFGFFNFLIDYNYNKQSTQPHCINYNKSSLQKQRPKNTITTTVLIQSPTFLHQSTHNNNYNQLVKILYIFCNSKTFLILGLL